jgi:8-oxo-dGTP diphosphatase
MTPLSSAATAAALVQNVVPFDAVEDDHRARALSWMSSTDDIFRRAKPRTPDPHLVSYFVLLDRARGRVLLVEHRLAGLWLPPGGHVEPGEDPVQTVRREAYEELGIEAKPLDGLTSAFFLTWTMTRDAEPHTDVSLWFLLHGDSQQSLHWDRREFLSIRWWSMAALRAAPPELFDPHLSRFLAKLQTAVTCESGTTKG